MADEVTYTSVKKIKWSWVASAGGTMAEETSASFDGAVLSLVTVPGAPTPDANYDITVTDVDGNDVLAGQGANRHETNTEQVVASLGAVSKSKLTLNVSAAGTSTQGDVYLNIR